MDVQTNYIAKNGENFAEAFNDKIAEVVIDRINATIDLDSIIKEDNANRLKAFEEAKAAIKPEYEDIKEDMVYEEITFNTVMERLQYAFEALVHKWLTLTHDVSPSGEVVVKIYRLESEARYQLSGKYSVNIKSLN